MKTEYKVKSDRYGHTHSFVQVEDNKYDFIPEENWMPVYITSTEDGKGIEFIDTEGGPCIGVGFKTDEIVVESIVVQGSKILFILKEIGE